MVHNKVKKYIREKNKKVDHQKVLTLKNNRSLIRGNILNIWIAICFCWIGKSPQRIQS